MSREHLLAPLPEEPRERVEKPEPEQARPAEPELLEPTAKPTRREPPVEARRALYQKALPGRHRRDLNLGNPQRNSPRIKTCKPSLRRRAALGVPSATVINRVLGRRQK